jgi:hypothetical protein
MMHLYCQCGHPIAAAAQWDGRDFQVTLHDEQTGTGKDSAAIVSCPRCGQPISLGRLRFHMPAGLRWLTEREQRDDSAGYAS